MPALNKPQLVPDWRDVFMMPKITERVMFCTAQADAICSAFEVVVTKDEDR